MKLEDYCDQYKSSSKFEQGVIYNFLFITEKLKNTIVSSDYSSILDYADYILQYVQFIVVEANCKKTKVFSMFESINSKGKKLEDIETGSRNIHCEKTSEVRRIIGKTHKKLNYGNRKRII